jgi:hypothetical protein
MDQGAVVADVVGQPERVLDGGVYDVGILAAADLQAQGRAWIRPFPRMTRGDAHMTGHSPRMPQAPPSCIGLLQTQFGCRPGTGEFQC